MALFKKHCVVAAFLEAQEPNYTAVVLDADVNAVSFSRGLDDWLTGSHDLQFYYRCAAGDYIEEVAAGNYIARNTPAAIGFLRRWSGYEFRQPKGYSSYDNGALMEELARATARPAAQQCTSLYENLTASEFGQEYRRFARCVSRTLGVPRVWRLGGGDGPSGSFAIWPKLQFFVDDGACFENKYNASFGPVMHHAVKDQRQLLCMYYSDLPACQLRAGSGLVDRESLSAAALRWITWSRSRSPYRFRFRHGETSWLLTRRCSTTLSCAPIGLGAAPGTRRPQAMPDLPLPRLTGASPGVAASSPWRWGLGAEALEPLSAELLQSAAAC